MNSTLFKSLDVTLWKYTNRVLLPIFGFIVTSLNILIIYAIWKSKRNAQDYSYIPKTSLCIFDILLGISLIFLIDTSHSGFEKNTDNVRCFFTYNMIEFVNWGIMLSTFGVTLDVFIKINNPLKYPLIVTWKRSIIVIIFAWVITLALFSLHAILWTRSLCLNKKSYISRNIFQKYLYITYTLILPLLIILIILSIHAKIFMIARKHRNCRAVELNCSTRKGWKDLVTLLILVGIILITCYL